MRDEMLIAFVLAVSAAAASAQAADASGDATNAPQSNPPKVQAAGSSGDVTNAPQSSPPKAQVAASPGNEANAFQPSSAINDRGTFGLGPMLGEPMGLTVKYWFSDITAVDGGLGWSLVDPDGTQLHADVLFHKFDPFRSDIPDFALYLGVGARVKFTEHGDNLAGIRVPFGVSYLLQPQRLEFYAEVAPILDVAPTTTVNWNGGIGIRYYFK